MASPSSIILDQDKRRGFAGDIANILGVQIPPPHFCMNPLLFRGFIYVFLRPEGSQALGNEITFGVYRVSRELRHREGRLRGLTGLFFEFSRIAEAILRRDIG